MARTNRRSRREVKPPEKLEINHLTAAEKMRNFRVKNKETTSILKKKKSDAQLYKSKKDAAKKEEKAKAKKKIKIVLKPRSKK